ncbi:cytochrome c family protein [Pseudovibrio exalbescens]|uniref:c-type cytochrome n=1 Tax=Pseudovibrio exalbescens TaxID=197461 RepID=UPI0023668C07|nr:cytochrome c family protein [Pseudovibrio exalbescens]MDD7911378.1 cytochrome c family protein [Pseudovibrio exalbescens]
MKRLVGALVSFGVALAATSAMAEGDPGAGEKVFRKCQACHAVGEDAKNKVGPVLNGVVGAGWGHIDGYRYSKPLLAGKEEGRVWDMETLSAYLRKPKDVIPKGRMAFAGLRKDADIENVIAYLNQYNLDGTTK